MQTRYSPFPLFGGISRNNPATNWRCEAVFYRQIGLGCALPILTLFGRSRRPCMGRFHNVCSCEDTNNALPGADAAHIRFSCSFVQSDNSTGGRPEVPTGRLSHAQSRAHWPRKLTSRRLTQEGDIQLLAHKAIRMIATQQGMGGAAFNPAA